MGTSGLAVAAVWLARARAVLTGRFNVAAWQASLARRWSLVLELETSMQAGSTTITTTPTTRPPSSPPPPPPPATSSSLTCWPLSGSQETTETIFPPLPPSALRQVFLSLTEGNDYQRATTRQLKCRSFQVSLSARAPDWVAVTVVCWPQSSSSFPVPLRLDPA